MKTEEILLKAIKKAEANGYKFWNINPKLVKLSRDKEWWFYKTSPYNYYASVHATIFSHSFAKAFWGEEGMKSCHIPAWQHHLMQMILKENPLEYLEQFLVANPTNHTH